MIGLSESENRQLLEIGQGDEIEGVRKLIALFKKDTISESEGLLSVNMFISKYIIKKGTRIKTPGSLIYQTYLDFCSDELLTPIGRNRFYRLLRSEGCRSGVNSDNTLYFYGI